jgi:hypothetical protein
MDPRLERELAAIKAATKAIQSADSQADILTAATMLLRLRTQGFLLLNVDAAGEVLPEYYTLNEVARDMRAQAQSEVAIFHDGKCIGMFKLMNDNRRSGNARFGFKMLDEYDIKRDAILSDTEREQVVQFHIDIGKTRGKRR